MIEYYKSNNAKLYNCNCLEYLQHSESNVFDCCVTSPPYDDLRIYKGYEFNFENIANELYRVMKKDSFVCWVVSDKVKNNNESLTSFKQALYFQSIGFRVRTMIYQKRGISTPSTNFYHNCYEYVFILIKGKKNINYINDIINKYVRKREKRTRRNTSNKMDKINGNKENNIQKRSNIWNYSTGYLKTTKDIYSYEHPALMPEKIAEDLIYSFSNKNDTILDIAAGSSTTGKMAILLNRKYVGVEISKEYCDISVKRISYAESEINQYLFK